MKCVICEEEDCKHLHEQEVEEFKRHWAVLFKIPYEYLWGPPEPLLVEPIIYIPVTGSMDA